MPTHTVEVTLSCDSDAFSYEEAVEFINDHLTAVNPGRGNPPGHGAVGQFIDYDAKGRAERVWPVDWEVE